MGLITRRIRLDPGHQPAAAAAPVVGTLRITHCPDAAQAGRTFPLRGGETTIGRDRGNLIVLDDPGVSGRHARIVLRGTEHRLVDLQSTNGSHLNGIRILEVGLRPGDSILIGSTVLRYEGPEAG